MSDKPHILLLGATGQVGHALRDPLSAIGTVTAATRDDADLADEASLRTLVRTTAPDIIVNAAAYTAVDQAEDEPERAMAINGLASGILAEEAARLDAWMVHYSTDYVFDGQKRTPYTEDDTPSPLGVYGRTKRAGEKAIQQVGGGRPLILRTSWVYSLRRSNFLRTMLRLAHDHDVLTVVDDQTGCPTWAGWIADATTEMLTTILDRDDPAGDSGVYHLSSAGSTTWCGFARAIFERFGKSVRVDPIATEDYPTKAERPRYSVLDTQRVQQRFGLRVPSWQEQLDACTRHAKTMNVSPDP